MADLFSYCGNCGTAADLQSNDENCALCGYTLLRANICNCTKLEFSGFEPIVFDVQVVKAENHVIAAPSCKIHGFTTTEGIFKN